jgi:hypothetical protein
MEPVAVGSQLSGSLSKSNVSSPTDSENKKTLLDYNYNKFCLLSISS